MKFARALYCLLTGKDPNADLVARVEEKTAMIARIRNEHDEELRRIRGDN